MGADGGSFDYVIAGGGSAGCVLAARLSEDPDVSVLLLEAGGRDRGPLYHWPAGFARMTKGVASWGWSTVPQAHLGARRVWFTQARVIGGGSSINAQIYTRGNPRDYDGWDVPGWSWAEVLPFFRKAEANERFADAYHGGDGPLAVSMPRATLPVCDAFIRAGQQWGLPYNPDFNGARQLGVGYYQLTQRDARRCSAATAYLRPAEGRPNLTVRTGAEARRVLVERGRATGIEARIGTGRHQFRATREVILAAGAIGSPRLLLLSGIGPAGELRAAGVTPVHDLPGVGRNLHDHVNVCALAELTGPHSYDGMERPHRTALAGLQYLLTRTGPAAASLFETGGFVALESEDWPEVQLHLGQGSGIEKGIATVRGAGVTLNSAFLRPQSRGSVRLASADPAAPPRIDPNYWAEPVDRAASARALEIAREILAQPALRPFVRREVLPGPEVRGEAALEDYMNRMAKTDHHPVGTCRMGTDADAVLDPALRLRGIDGLRVADASAMPAVPSCNTNAPTIMLAEKAAELIRGPGAA